MFSVRRVIATLVCAATLFGFVAPSAVAGIVADDYQTAVRPIVFPVVGTYSYTDTFGACRSGCTRGHEGTDIMAAKLTRLVAATDSTVSWLKNTATPDGSQGNYLILKDAEGWEYWYIHVNNDTPGTDDGANPPEWIFAPGIVRGSTVRAGELVGYVGDSGNAEWTAPHLHFEIHKPDGSIINPYRSLQEATVLSAPVPSDAQVEANRRFIEALSVDFLGRRATSTELAAGLDRLAAGQPRSAVVQSYATSDEWISVIVTGFYRSTLGRAPDGPGLRYWVDVMKRGVSAGDVAAYFYAGDEYFARSGSTAQGWISDLYAEILLRPADSSGLDYWVTLSRAGVSRSAVAFDFYRSIESRRTRVSALYQALLGRAPDVGGRDYWTGILLDGHDVRLAAELASSTEYFIRAGKRAL